MKTTTKIFIIITVMILTFLGTSIYKDLQYGQAESDSQWLQNHKSVFNVFHLFSGVAVHEDTFKLNLIESGGEMQWIINGVKVDCKLYNHHKDIECLYDGKQFYNFNK